MDNLKLEWLSDGRTMKLLQTFTYCDPKGVLWHAPSGVIVNGANIPRVLWTISGTPFVGKYRTASVMHDVYCGTRSRPHPQVHDMFWFLMIACGVSKSRADRMWWAVTTFGPKWDEIGNKLAVTEEEDAFINSENDEEDSVDKW